MKTDAELTRYVEEVTSCPTDAEGGKYFAEKIMPLPEPERHRIVELLHNTKQDWFLEQLDSYLANADPRDRRFTIFRDTKMLVNLMLHLYAGDRVRTPGTTDDFEAWLRENGLLPSADLTHESLLAGLRRVSKRLQAQPN
jgi:hypothetical protein